MVIIGGMRSLLGPRWARSSTSCFASICRSGRRNWLLFFGLLFVGFVVFSPTGLVGVWRRADGTAARARRRSGGDGRAHRSSRDCRCRRSCAASERGDGTLFAARGLAKAFGGIHAVEEASIAVADRTLHALIGPNGAGKTTLFNLISGLFAPDRGRVLLDGRDITGEPPHRIVAAGLARSFQITNLFPALTDRGEPAARGAGARS